MNDIADLGTHDALTELELKALKQSGELAQLIRQIIGDGPNSSHDWAEAAAHIHAIQNMVMSQAAARSYPDKFRLLGNKPTVKSE
jgi:hypothetical protein